MFTLQTSFKPLFLKGGRGVKSLVEVTLKTSVPITSKNSASGDGGGAHPPPFTTSTITYKVVVYAPAEWADTLPLFLLYP